MKVYLTGAFSHRQRLMGHGEAAHHIYETMKKMGLDVKCKGEDFEGEPDIEISFAHPYGYEFCYPNSYKIGYTAWESTELQPFWVEPLNKVNEIWTPSEWVAHVFRQKMPHKPVHVYKHGVSQYWSPRKRNYDPETDVFRFLNIGEPYDRKDAQLVVDTFIELYGDNPKFELILKCSKLNRTNRTNKETGELYSNIISYENFFSSKEMKHLYHSAHAFVYPSWGEGFGLQPLEAIATGLPTISTWSWADYHKYITLKIDSTYEVSPWQYIHPGFMMRPDAKQFKLAMKYAPKKYEELSETAFKNSFDAHKEWDWTEVTKSAVDRLKEIYNSRIQ